MTEHRGDPESLPPEVSWSVGCLVSAAALVGLVILALLVAIALQPPAWIQVVAGALLAVGGALFAWLVASALGRDGRPRLRRVPPPTGGMNETDRRAPPPTGGMNDTDRG